MTTKVQYRPTADGDLMQVYKNREVGTLGVRLAPDTASLFAAAPDLLVACHAARAEGRGVFK